MKTTTTRFEIGCKCCGNSGSAWRHESSFRAAQDARQTLFENGHESVYIFDRMARQTEWNFGLWLKDQVSRMPVTSGFRPRKIRRPVA